MKKIVKRILLIAMALCMSFQAFACSATSFINPSDDSGNVSPITPPAYKNPLVVEAPNEDNDDSSNNKYKITVKSVGGALLDGIRITASKNGIPVKTAISQNGIVTLSLEKDEYTLSVDSMPEGYYLAPNTDLTTSSESFEHTLLFRSEVLSDYAPVSKSYSIGDVMHEYSFVDTTNSTQTLSSLLATKKAVVINFFYTTCSPCRSEFPAIEEAYQQYKDDIALIALSDRDTNRVISSFKEDLDLSFIMGLDKAQLYKRFNVNAFPTTIIIDRYGIVVMRESGAIPDVNVWKSLFAKYTATNYVQDFNASTEEDKDDENVEMVKPTVHMPSSDTIAQAVSGSGFNATYKPETNENDAEYSWPFVVDEDYEGTYMTPANVGVNNSFAIIYATFAVNGGDVLSFEYNTYTEKDYDMLYVLLDGVYVTSFSGNSDGWQTCTLYVFNTASSKVELSFTYLKDSANATDFDTDSEFVGIKNIKITRAVDTDRALDNRTPVVSQISDDGQSYTDYPEVVLADDGYYHVIDENGEIGPMLFADMIGVKNQSPDPTPWSKRVFGSDTTHEDLENGTIYANSMYYITYWEISKSLEDDKVILNGKDYYNVLIDNHNMQGWSDNGLLPVYPELKNMFEDFAIEYADRYDLEVNENTWLEFCYTFVHYGPVHTNGQACFVNHNPVEGLSVVNAIEINAHPSALFSSQGYTFEADVKYPLAVKRGTRYKFTAPETGVYLFESLSNDTLIDPWLFVYSPDGKEVSEYDDIRDYDKVFDNPYNNFAYYVYLEKNESVILSLAFFMAGETGKYNVNVKHIGSSYSHVVTATTGDGAYTTTGDEITGETYYLAVDVAYSEIDKCYRVVDKNNNFASKVYIDFLYGNYFDQNGHSLYQIIEEGFFDFTSIGSGDYTQIMREYYYKSIAGKTESDEFYGLLEADEELVEILHYLISGYQEFNSSTELAKSGAWLQFACYVDYYGAEGTAPWDI